MVKKQTRGGGWYSYKLGGMGVYRWVEKNNAKPRLLNYLGSGE